MPPWGAVKGVGSFQNDPSLTEVEIQMIVAWVEGGAPKGDDPSPPPKLPATPKAVKSAVLKQLAVGGDMPLERPLVLLGIRPEGLSDRQAMLVDAFLPEGRIEHLIWLRDYRSAWTRDYTFRAPLKLPAGTTIHVKGPPAAKALLLY
jgi:hypothetical protein